ncbi:metallophosphoesterase, partial [Gemmatimonadota bacterium]
IQLDGGVLAPEPAASVGLPVSPADTGSAHPLDDGPHVFWATDSQIQIFYLCDGEFLHSAPTEVRGTISFTGMCADSDAEYVVSNRAHKPGKEKVDGISRIFAVSDIHGEYEALVDLLEKAGVVDEDLSWSWGDGHLVILGDVFDRGAMVTECLWLIHRLEREAAEEGGAVHYLLGNHELMALRGDLRYVNSRYMEGIVAEVGIEYEDLFGPDMELGRWLRSKNTAIKLNDVLFVHAGLGPEVVERGLSLQDINEGVREGIDFRSYAFVFSEMPGFLYQSAGPVWYRGYHRDQDGWYSQATMDDVEAVLDHFGATATVVGHTEVGQVEALYRGLVFGIDVPLERLGSFQALLWEGGRSFRVLGNGRREPLSGS